jgi:hypothetical protein
MEDEMKLRALCLDRIGRLSAPLVAAALLLGSPSFASCANRAASPFLPPGTHANCPVSQPIEGDKPQRTNGFEYNRGTTGTVGTSAVGTDDRLMIERGKPKMVVILSIWTVP